MTKEKDLDIFLGKIRSSIDNEEFVKLTLSKRVLRDQDLQNIYIRHVSLKGEPVMSFTYRYTTKDVVTNYSIDEGTNLLKTILGKNFLSADLFTIVADYQLKFNNKFVPKLLTRKATHKKTASKSHDNQKKRFIEPSNNVYLKSLGIVDQRGEVTKSMYDKYRQIDKYIEIVDSLVDNVELPESLQIFDMGAGKGYLTFALYDYLTNHKNKKAYIKGVERQENLVKICNNIAQKANFHNLEFIQGDINDFKTEEVDVLIALHACDTATDDAIFAGIQNDASIIITAPCCHKQIRQNIEIPDALKPMLKNGILLERQAEILTDGIRSLILEKHGYKSRVFEFISNEHTGKNLMITAVKSQTSRSTDDIDAEIQCLKKMYGIKSHYLETLIS